MSRYAAMFERLGHVLVPTAGKPDEYHAVGFVHRELQRMCERVRRFEGAQYPLALGKRLERRERFRVAAADIIGAAAVLEVRVLGPDCGVVEARRNRPGIGDLSLLVLKHIGFGAVEYPARAAQKRRAMLRAVEALAGGLDPDQPHRIVKEVGKQPDRVRTAADACHDGVGQAAKLTEHLRARFASDHALELAHHRRERVRTGGGAEQIVRVLEACRPVAQRLVDRIL